MAQQNVVLHASALELLDGESSPHLAPPNAVAISIDVSAELGAAPLLDFSLEWSPDGVNWGPKDGGTDVFTQIAGSTPTVSKRFDVQAPWYKLVWEILPVPVAEVQAVEHDHTGGSFTMSYDGEGPTLDLGYDAPLQSLLAQGTLTMDVKPSDDIAAVGTLTITVPVTDLDTITIDSQTYRLMDTPAQAYDIEIGADEPETKVNLILAINATGTEGVNYFAGTLVHPTVSAATFQTDTALFTAITPGVVGTTIVFTETFDAGGNVMNGSGTLDATTEGTDADTLTIDGRTYTFEDVLQNIDGHVFIGASLSTAQDNLEAAIGLGAGAGTLYALATTANPGVTFTGFGGDDAVITAVTDIAATGNAIGTVETFLAGTNVFDATTLGTTLLGENGFETELEKFPNMQATYVKNATGDYDVTFPITDGDDVALMTIDGGNLTGGASATVTETTKGIAVSFTFYAAARHS